MASYQGGTGINSSTATSQTTTSGHQYSASNTATDLIMADGFEALPPIDTDTYFIHSDHLGTPRRVTDAYAAGVDNARQMVRGDDGVLFVGSRRAGNVYALSDTNGGGVIDRQQLIAEDLKMHKEKESLHKNLTLMGVFCSQRFENIPIALHKPTSEYFMYLPQSPDRGAR